MVVGIEHGLVQVNGPTIPVAHPYPQIPSLPPTLQSPVAMFPVTLIYKLLCAKAVIQWRLSQRTLS